jgi:hypothetical protein
MSDQTITIGGREWPLPKLAPKQNRVVVGLLYEYLPRLQEAYRAALVDPEDASKGVRRVDMIKAFADAKSQDDLGTIAFMALTRASPDLTREQFDDLPTDLEELLTALSAIARAAGVLR